MSEIILNGVDYSLILYAGSTRYVLTDIAKNLGWDEGDSEMSTRITFALKDEKTKYGYPSKLLKLGRKCIVRAKCGSMDEEVARGKIVNWQRKTTSSEKLITIKCYGPLIAFKSQVHLFFEAGMTTKAIFRALCKECGVNIGSYKGPNKKHGKTCYKSKSVSNAVTELLDDAKKHGSSKFVVTEKNDKVVVLPYGYNSAVWQFTREHIISTEHTRSTEKIVTRVRVIGQSDKEGRAPVEATINGKTKYGIRQKLVTRSKDDDLSKAKSSAKDILDDEGDVDDTISITTVDVPFLHKGEKVHIKFGTMNGYYFVCGVSHDASTQQMTMKLKTEKSVKKK